MASTSLKSALLVMDMQVGILGMFQQKDEIIEKVKLAVTHARSKQMPVIYVVVGFRKGLPEISPFNKGFGANKERLMNANLEEWMTVHPSLAPAEGEVTLVKRRVSAFSGSDLEVILRAQGIQHLVLTGIATSGVVLSTTREAADKDFMLTILSDACADADAQVHEVLTTKVFTRQADVLTVGEWVK